MPNITIEGDEKVMVWDIRNLLAHKDQTRSIKFKRSNSCDRILTTQNDLADTSSNEEEESDESEEMQCMMMWDDDIALNEDESDPHVLVNGGLEEQQRESLLFSTQDLKEQYHQLQYLSIDKTLKRKHKATKSIDNGKEFNKLTIPNLSESQTSRT